MCADTRKHQKTPEGGPEKTLANASSQIGKCIWSFFKISGWTKKSSVWRWWCWFTQDSFIAFLASDPVGLRPYKQFFRRQKLGSDSIWLRWVGAGWHNSDQTNPRPVRSHPRQGQKNFMIRESLTKPWNSWGFIKKSNFHRTCDHSDVQQQFASGCVFKICAADISWICTVGSYGFVCDQTYWAGGSGGGSMVWKILEINSLCGNQSGFLPFGKWGSWTINRGLLAPVQQRGSWQNSK